MSSRGYPNARTPQQVIAQLEPMFAASVHRFWPDDVELADETVFHHRQLVGSRQITDAYLLALAVKHRGRLLTIDGGISSTLVVGASKAHLIALV